jgi:hypothetical protein
MLKILVANLLFFLWVENAKTRQNDAGTETPGFRRD